MKQCKFFYLSCYFWITKKFEYSWRKVFHKALNRDSILLSGIHRLQGHIVSFNIKVELRWSIGHYDFLHLKYFWKANNKFDRRKMITDSDKRHCVSPRRRLQSKVVSSTVFVEAKYWVNQLSNSRYILYVEMQDLIANADLFTNLAGIRVVSHCGSDKLRTLT